MIFSAPIKSAAPTVGTDADRRPRRLGSLLLCSLTAALSACALQPPAATALPNKADAWSEHAEGVTSASRVNAQDRWWAVLADEGMSVLIDAAQNNSPTLAQAIARIDEARATVASAGASQLPSLSAQAVGSRGTSQSPSGVVDTRASGSLSLSWELDLFGRLRHGRAAATMRLDARTAEAQSTHLSLQADVADTVLWRRACAQLEAAQRTDTQSRQITLELTEKKRQVGMLSPADVARAQTGLAEARGMLASTQGQCVKYQQSLVALTGLSSAEVSQALTRSGPIERTALPQAPDTQLALPASVLAAHPGVVAALRSADAAYEEIGSARAARLPSLNLSALLTHNWLFASGGTSHSDVWSLGPTLSAALFDNGVGAANVEGAQARYTHAMAALKQTLLTAVRDIETALGQMASVQDRVVSGDQGALAAEALFVANDASWRAGRLSLFELEDARRTLSNARSTAITARRDSAQAWVALVKATGNAVQTSTKTATL